ncbi:MAG: type II toxin-antitoxin system RelE/ParE family toxin [Sneathiellaceae bacterium]
MSVYATKAFARFARKAGLDDAKLLQAAYDVAIGRFDADLGGGVYKQRVARGGSGKSGSFRTIILFRAGGNSFFAHGFAKSDKANVSARELQALKRLAGILLDFTDEQVEAAQSAGEVVEVAIDGGTEENE